MEKANSDEHMTGEIARAKEPMVAEMPFNSPRRSGPVALLRAKAIPT